MAEQQRNPGRQEIEFFVNDHAIKTNEEELTVERILQQAGDVGGAQTEAESILIELRGESRVEHEDLNERIRIQPNARFEIEERGEEAEPVKAAPAGGAQQPGYAKTVGQPTLGGMPPREGATPSAAERGNLGERSQGAQRTLGAEGPRTGSEGVSERKVASNIGEGRAPTGQPGMERRSGETAGRQAGQTEQTKPGGVEEDERRKAKQQKT